MFLSSIAFFSPRGKIRSNDLYTTVEGTYLCGSIKVPWCIISIVAIKNLHFSSQTHSTDSCLHASRSFLLLRAASVYISGLCSTIWFIFLLQEWVQNHLVCHALDSTVFQAFSDRVIHFPSFQC